MIKYDNLSDQELVDRIRSTGDPYWFGVLYDRFSKKVYNKCLLILKNESDAEDLTHDIFLKVYISLKQFQGKSSFGTWLYVITYNFCISFVRKKNKPEEFTEQHEMPDEPETDDNEFLKLRLQQLEWALEEISTEEKMILLMKYQDDMSLKEIQEIFNLGESAVKMRIKRAKKKVMDLCLNNKTI